MFKKLSIRNIYQAISFLGMFLILCSCMPESRAPRLQSGNQESTTGGNTSGSDTQYSQPTFPLAGLFVQEGTTQTLSQFSLPINFSDSFMLRGLELSTYLANVPSSTKFCIAAKYNINNSSRFLLLSAKPRDFKNTVLKTREYFLFVEPNNTSANQSDCLVSSLTSVVLATTPASTPYFSLSQICSDCPNAVSSEGFKLYFTNGSTVPNLNFSNIKLTISGSSTGSGNSCQESTACQARGYHCCLDSQCVIDGATRPNVDENDPSYQSAKTDVASNPNNFVFYPQYYFVCPSRPGTDPGTSGGTQGGSDPNYEARIRLLEYQQLYDCLNQVDGEFSYCTLKYVSASNNISSGTRFKANNDDVTFQSTRNANFNTGFRSQNIVSIFYAGQTLYDARIQKNLDPADGTIHISNDNLASGQEVTITKSLPTNAQDDNLYLTYKIDGSCKKVGSTLAQCKKKYIFGYDKLESTYYHPGGANKTFYLPDYADTHPVDSNIIVKISGVTVPKDTSTWSAFEVNGKGISFNSSYTIYLNQEIEITYYVNSNVTALTQTKQLAQDQVNTMCLCNTGMNCNLSPILDPTTNAVVNYSCVYPNSGGNEPPSIQSVAVSGKNTPHRYYDQNGVLYDSEDRALANGHEGTEFKYLGNNNLLPSNLSNHSDYTGFNEIYGSFSKTNAQSARPAKMIRVKKDTTYDIYTNSGAFSTCINCGSDYYNSLQKIFPQSFIGVGGGYIPDQHNSSRLSNNGAYRSDDLLFGRACFVPATMIPWTHRPGTSVTQQRRDRLAAQHFMFANGYNKDWYGFDYGSVIGSFDGVTWFSIGTKRRIKASTSKLFLAVNAYFGDLTTDNVFELTVAETTPYSNDIPDHDLESDGAQCQRNHLCSTDNDCFSQLGYDYTCQSVTGLTTHWPKVDANGTEILSSGDLRNLAQIVGGSNGFPKRCVYRGRGAACLPNLNSLLTSNPPTTFNGTSQVGNLSCSPNSMCQPLTSGNKFNDRISRFAGTLVAQNTAISTIPANYVGITLSDTVGLGARVLGRPYEFYGTKAFRPEAGPALTANNVGAICIPGKDLNLSANTFDLNSKAPNLRVNVSDKMFGIGTTASSSFSGKYLNACPAVDLAGYSVQHYNVALGSPDINLLTISQNLSTNLLDLPTLNSKIFNSSATTDSQVTSIGYQRNACLRAPGRSCFSDLDCAPSSFIADKVKLTPSLSLNSAERKYWEEDLICGNPEFKYPEPGVLNTSSWDVTKNVCCRDFGKTFTVFTQTNTSDFAWCSGTNIQVAGVTDAINTASRYSRVHTGYDKMTCNPAEVTSTKTFALSVSATNGSTRFAQIPRQWKTLDTINQRTCCTKNWIRSFDSSNGGGHTWKNSSQQTFKKENLKSISWLPNFSDPTDPGANLNPFFCELDGYLKPSCEIRDLSTSEENHYLKFFGSLELTGIPQVPIMTEDQVSATVSIASDATLGLAPAIPTIPGTMKPLTAGHFNSSTKDFVDSTGPHKYYSANNTDGFASNGLKKVFSDNEFNCCIPAGNILPSNTTASQCCTGNLGNDNGNGPLRCCLPDYTNLSVYLNRYVSSEGNHLDDSAYDPHTGFITEPALVEQIAKSKKLCCSGTIMRGKAVGNYFIPIEGGVYVNQADARTRRFTYINDGSIDNNSVVGPVGQVFDLGVRWNDHVYCVPKNLPGQFPN